MPNQATYDDANLILRLYELRREPRLRQARSWFVSSFKVNTVEEFDALCPPGSEANASFRMVISYWEMAASLVTSGVLNPELFGDNSSELLFVWERLRNIIPALRDRMKNPYGNQNLEKVALEMTRRHDGRAPEFMPVFRKMVAGG